MKNPHAPRTLTRSLELTRAERARRTLPILALAGLAFLSPHAVFAEPAPAGPAASHDKERDKPADKPSNAVSDAAAMSAFLDRLMLAESGGRDDARNPLSTAVGPFQFIETTFLNVVRKHFAAETGELTNPQVLKLRTNRHFARRAAEAFTRDNAALLAIAGFEASFANLRLAHLVGPGGAVRVLKAPVSTPAVAVLGGRVARANPFLVRMTTGDLVRWSIRNLEAKALANSKITADPNRVGKAANTPAKPAIAVHCNRGLASCRRWIALAKSRLARKERVAAGSPKRRR